MVRLKWAMRTLAVAGVAAAAIAFGIQLGSQDALAQSKTLKIIVPYTPGSGPDIISRLMGEQIGKAGGPTVVVENRPGGGMTIGTEAAARAEPDGNTVLLVANAFTVNMAMKRGNFTLASFEPVCNLASTPMPLVVQSSSPWKTVQELVDYAKANPGKFTFASGGPATSLHVAIEVLRLATKIETNYVPYGGSGPGDQRADRRPRPGGVGGLSDRGVAYQERHAAGVGHDLAQAHRRTARRADADRNRHHQIRGRDLLRRRGAGEDAAGRAERAIGTMLTNAMNTPEMKEKFAQQGLFPDGTVRRQVRQLPARHHRRLRARHDRGRHQAELTQAG